MKTLKILLIGLLLIWGGQSFAQDGTSPFVNSTHVYSVTPGDAGNNFVWTVLLENGNPAVLSTDYTITGGTTTSASITWLKANDGSNAHYMVQLSEESTDNCITLRQFQVTVQANTFFLAAGADGNECHDEDGNVLISGASAATTVDFTVTLDNATYLLDLTTWEFDLAFVLAGSYAITEVQVGGNVVAAPYNSISIAGTEENVTVSVKVTGNVEIAETVTMTVSNGKAIKGAAVTLDNNSGDKVQALTINALPATSAITTD